MLTGMERIMYDAQKHMARITTTDGNVFTGLCTVFTPDYDNDPEVSTLTMKDPLKNGEPFIGQYVEFEVSDIKTIEHLD